MAKGASYERRVCLELSRWWCGHSRTLVFWRTSNSGGGATVRHRKGVSNQAHAGDITAIEPTALPLTRLVTLEVKVGYSKKKQTQGSVHDLLDRTDHRTLYEEWVVQAREAATRAATPYWLLVHKRDGRRAMCYMPSYLYAVLAMRKCFERQPVPFVAMTVNVRDGKTEEPVSIVGMRFDRWLGCVDPADVMALTKGA